MEEASVGAGEKESAYASIVAEAWAKCKEDLYIFILFIPLPIIFLEGAYYERR